MDMDMDIFKIAAIGLIGVVLSSILKGYKPEFATYVIITTVMVIFIMVLYKLTYLFEFLTEIYDQLWKEFLSNYYKGFGSCIYCRFYRTNL